MFDNSDLGMLSIGSGVMEVLPRNYVSPKFSATPSSRTVCRILNILFFRCKYGTDFPYHHAEFDGIGTCGLG